MAAYTERLIGITTMILLDEDRVETIKTGSHRRVGGEEVARHGHGQAGSPLHVLQELGGWESVEMVRCYAHLSSEHLTPYVNRMCNLRVVESEAGATIQLR